MPLTKGYGEVSELNCYKSTPTDDRVIIGSSVLYRTPRVVIPSTPFSVEKKISAPFIHLLNSITQLLIDSTTHSTTVENTFIHLFVCPERRNTERRVSTFSTSGHSCSRLVRGLVFCSGVHCQVPTNQPYVCGLRMQSDLIKSVESP